MKVQYVVEVPQQRVERTVNNGAGLLRPTRWYGRKGTFIPAAEPLSGNRLPGVSDASCELGQVTLKYAHGS